MNWNGLSSAERRAALATFVSPHRVRVRAKVLNLAGDHLADISSYLLDGQVDVDNTAEITRSASIVLLDPKRSMPFDGDHPADTALFMDRMIRVYYELLLDDDWVQFPIFTGPVSSLQRDGDLVTAECQGKEALAMGACWRPITLAKGEKKVDAIQRLLSDRAGEDRFDFPDLPARLPTRISLHRQAVPWARAHRIAASMNRQLFYDGAGTCRLRRYPSVSALTLTGEHHLTSDLRATYNPATANTVWVKGGTPKGAKTPVEHTAVAPANHPLSPVRLGRNGVPRYLIEEVQNEAIRTAAEARDLAQRKLNDRLRQHVEVTFDCVPLPFLDPGDMLHAATDDSSVTFRLNQFSLPLRAGDAMSMGYLRNVSLLYKRHRHHRHHRRR